MKEEDKSEDSSGFDSKHADIHLKYGTTGTIHRQTILVHLPNACRYDPVISELFPEIA